MGETLNTWKNVSTALTDAAGTMVSGAGKGAVIGANALAVWSGAAQEGMDYTEGALEMADASSVALKELHGIDVPSVPPGGCIGAMTQAEQWVAAMDTANTAVAEMGSAVQAEQGGECLGQYTKAIIEGVMKVITNAQLHGPISNAGAGFSIGSPFFHVVIIPFGDAKLNPLNQLK